MQHVKENRPEDALQSLQAMTFFFDEDHELYDGATLVRGSFQRLRVRDTKGLVTVAAFEAELTIISQRMLKLARDYVAAGEDDATSQEQSKGLGIPSRPGTPSDTSGSNDAADTAAGTGEVPPLPTVSSNALGPSCLVARDLAWSTNQGLRLGGMDIDLHRGEIVAVVGRNASGKSSLLEVLAQAKQPDAGSVEYFGLAGDGPATLAASTDRIAYLRQRLEPPHDTVEMALLREAVSFGLPPANAKAAVENAIGYLGLAPHRFKPHGRLSGGFQVRFALAVCLIRRPRVLLLDEPLAALDPTAQGPFLRILEQMARGPDRTGIIVTSQHVNQIERFANRVVLLGSGRVEFDGDRAAARSMNDSEIYEYDGALDLATVQERLKGARAERSNATSLVRVRATDMGSASLAGALIEGTQSIAYFHDLSSSVVPLLEQEPAHDDGTSGPFLASDSDADDAIHDAPTRLGTEVSRWALCKNASAHYARLHILAPIMGLLAVLAFFAGAQLPDARTTREASEQLGQFGERFGGLLAEYSQLTDIHTDESLREKPRLDAELRDLGREAGLEHCVPRPIPAGPFRTQVGVYCDGGPDAATALGVAGFLALFLALGLFSWITVQSRDREIFPAARRRWSLGVAQLLAVLLLLAPLPALLLGYEWLGSGAGGATIRIVPILAALFLLAPAVVANALLYMGRDPTAVVNPFLKALGAILCVGYTGGFAYFAFGAKIPAIAAACALVSCVVLMLLARKGPNRVGVLVALADLVVVGLIAAVIGTNMAPLVGAAVVVVGTLGFLAAYPWLAARLPYLSLGAKWWRSNVGDGDSDGDSDGVDRQLTARHGSKGS